MNNQILQIKKLLRLRMNGVASTAMRNHGLNYKLNYGLDAMSVRDIASRFQPDAALAERLWNENARECKILGTLLFPKAEFTSLKADLWLTQCHVPELMEQLCFNLLQHLDFAPEKSKEWIESPDPEIRIAGYNLLLRLILARKRLPELSPVILIAESDVMSDRFRLQQVAGRFLERIKIVE